MDLPLVAYRVCYVLGTILLLVPEIIAAWVDTDPGDTITEHIRPVIQSTSFGWFLAAALIAWLGYHFLIEPPREW